MEREMLSYEDQLRERITQLRVEKNVSEHKMSLELGKSGAYVRSITSGIALPSVKELMNIIRYFDLTPVEFFRDFEQPESPQSRLCDRIRKLSPEDQEKVNLFLDWIE